MDGFFKILMMPDIARPDLRDLPYAVDVKVDGISSLLHAEFSGDQGNN